MYKCISVLFSYFPLSSQANQLAIHQHQLNRPTSLTEELVNALQNLCLTPTETPPAPITAPENPITSSASSVNPRLAFPEKLNGSPAKCKEFLLQCSLFVNQQLTLYPTDSSRIEKRMDQHSLPLTYFYNASERSLNILLEVRVRVISYSLCVRGKPLQRNMP